MGILKSLFGGKKKKKPPGRKYWSNAPTHWPEVYVRQFQAPHIEQVRAHDSLVIASVLKDVPGLKVTQFGKPLLFPGGVLEVDIEAVEGGRTYHIFVYPPHDVLAPALFEKSRRLLEEKKLASVPVYYSGSTWDAGAKQSRANPLRELDTSHFRKMKEKPPKGMYSIWWTTPEEPRFHKSPTLRSVREIYGNICGYEYILLTTILKEQGLVKDEPGTLIGLPDDGLTLPMRGPDDVVVIMSANSEKGLRFHLPRTVSVKYREDFYANLSRFTKNLREYAKSRKNDLRDPNYDGGPAQWFEFATRVMEKQEKEDGANIDCFASVLIE